MAETDQAALRSELADIEETLRRLAAESGNPAEDAAQDVGDAGLDLTQRMEVEAQVESLTLRRDQIRGKLQD
jgi:hypothetical protein